MEDGDQSRAQPDSHVEAIPGRRMTVPSEQDPDVHIALPVGSAFGMAAKEVGRGYPEVPAGLEIRLQRAELLFRHRLQSTAALILSEAPVIIHSREALENPRRLSPAPAHLAGAGDLLPGAARSHAGLQLRRAGHLRRHRARRGSRPVPALGSVPRQLRSLARLDLPQDRLALAVDGRADHRALPDRQLSRRLLPRDPGAAALEGPAARPGGG